MRHRPDEIVAERPGEKHRLLGNVGNVAPPPLQVLGVQWLAADEHHARVGLEQAEREVGSGGLAGARRPGDRRDPTARNHHVQPADAPSRRGVAEVDVAELEHRNRRIVRKCPADRLAFRRPVLPVRASIVGQFHDVADRGQRVRQIRERSARAPAPGR